MPPSNFALLGLKDLTAAVAGYGYGRNFCQQGATPEEDTFHMLLKASTSASFFVRSPAALESA